MKRHKLIRRISKALFALLCSSLFSRDSALLASRRGLSQLFLKLFIMALILTGLGALTMRVERARPRV